MTPIPIYDINDTDIDVIRTHEFDDTDTGTCDRAYRRRHLISTILIPHINDTDIDNGDRLMIYQSHEAQSDFVPIPKSIYDIDGTDTEIDTDEIPIGRNAKKFFF